MSNFPQLSPNQRRALTALLSEKTVRDAAKKCRLSEQTLYRYLSDALFREEIQKANAAIYTEASNRLTADVLSAFRVYPPTPKLMEPAKPFSAAK